MIIKGKTTTGFEFEFDSIKLNDMEIVDAICDLQDEDEVTAMNSSSIIITKLLGKEQKKKLYNFERTEDGRVPIDIVTNDIVEIMASCKQGKN